MKNRFGGSILRVLATGAVALAGMTGATLGVVTAGAQAELSSPICSWSGESDQRDVNIGAPDSDAFYWLSPIVPNPGTEVVISGLYPRSRYFSFHVYNEQGQALGSIYDQHIDPAQGSANPFLAKPQSGTGDSYQLTIRFEARPASPAPNTIYAGEAGSTAADLPVYRDYVPVEAGVPGGGVALPKVTIASSTGTPLVSEAACSTTPPAFGSALWQTFAEASWPDGLPSEPPAQPSSSSPQWARAFGSQLGNQQNAYLETVVSHAHGQIVVIHTRAPTFPNTSAGQPAYKKAQLRYWSFCTYVEGEALVGCEADYHAVIQPLRKITYVISDAASRPANATAANGVTWLPWGAQGSVEIVYRNMLPAASFPYAAESITSPTQSVQQTMGPYYPSAVYCSTATFEAGGWGACKRASEGQSK